jgi:hypothetical protein
MIAETIGNGLLSEFVKQAQLSINKSNPLFLLIGGVVLNCCG